LNGMNCQLDDITNEALVCDQLWMNEFQQRHWKAVEVTSE
jgi:hypothetical protein